MLGVDWDEDGEESLADDLLTMEVIDEDDADNDKPEGDLDNFQA